jgi:hypothetical protein
LHDSPCNLANLPGQPCVTGYTFLNKARTTSAWP